jgi:hypothetical protein
MPNLSLRAHLLQFAIALAPLAAVGLIACSSLPCLNPGGPVQNANVDTHCVGQAAQAVDPAVCTVAAATDPNDPSVVNPNLVTASVLSDPNVVSPYVYAAANANEFGVTLYNNSGDDDDCKYHINFTVDPVCPNHDTHFLLSLTNKLTGEPVTGAVPSIEAFLGPNHVAPKSATSATEKSAGQYAIGPVRFDAGGTWTVRFHFFENCIDSPSSPHGHAAFFINVPSL